MSPFLEIYDMPSVSEKDGLGGAWQQIGRQIGMVWWMFPVMFYWLHEIHLNLARDKGRLGVKPFLFPALTNHREMTGKIYDKEGINGRFFLSIIDGMNICEPIMTCHCRRIEISLQLNLRSPPKAVPDRSYFVELWQVTMLHQARVSMLWLRSRCLITTGRPKRKENEDINANSWVGMWFLYGA